MIKWSLWNWRALLWWELMPSVTLASGVYGLNRFIVVLWVPQIVFTNTNKLLYPLLSDEQRLLFFFFYSNSLTLGNDFLLKILNTNIQYADSSQLLIEAVGIFHISYLIFLMKLKEHLTNYEKQELKLNLRITRKMQQ